jgi:AcrR family transcriptional regulator
MLETMLAGGDGQSFGSKVSYDEVLRLMQAYMPASDPSDPKARKHARLIEAATQLFVRNGFRKTSIDDVARRAHVAKGTVYLYFKNKPDLLTQCIVHEKTRFVSKLKPFFAKPLPPREMLRTWLSIFFQGLEEMPLTARMISGDREIIIALDEMDSALKGNALDIQVDFVARLIDQAAAPHRYTQQEIEDRAKVLIGVLYSAGALFDERVRGGLDRERYGELLARILADGIAPVVDDGKN